MLDYNPIISYIVFMKPHYPFIASKNYKGGTTTGCSTSHRIMPSSCYGPVLIPGPISAQSHMRAGCEEDLGSVRKKNFMYEYHPGCYCARCKNKRQATSHKLQAKVASIKQLLTKLIYKII